MIFVRNYDFYYTFQTVEAAKADAERIRLIGEAEAYSVEAIGKADAERMRMKAAAYKNYGDAAIMSMVLDSLPQVGFVDSFYIFLWMKDCSNL